MNGSISYFLLWALAFSVLFMPSCHTATRGTETEKELTDYVDPFIGSDGHVFVGANVPFGMVQASPANFNK